jgi:hypothetical protein
LFHPAKEVFSVTVELWRVKAAISAMSIGTAIMSNTVIEQVRKELRRQTGHSMDPARHRTQSHPPEPALTRQNESPLLVSRCRRR